MTTLYDSLNYTPNELSFGTSGLRGLVTDITDLEAYINTTGFIDFVKQTQGLDPDAIIYTAGDLRDSTPRILCSVHQAITDSGCRVIFGGFVPTPAIAFYGLEQNSASIMVTGSHIPSDRNGIKFNKLGGEVLKPDETRIKEAVAKVRKQLYDQDVEQSLFTADGSLKTPPILSEIDNAIAEAYEKRYEQAFSENALAGKKIVFYEHSAVGRDIIPRILQSLGADVVRVDRTDYFVPIDTENVTKSNQEYFKKLASDHPGAFAIVSTDGDSDRPFVIDEHGLFHRGDELGAIVAVWLKATFAAFPISSSDAVDHFLTSKDIAWKQTRIGSPYVIDAMNTQQSGNVAGWEVNGGFLLGSDVATSDGILKALPTRDAALPIIIALVAAAESQQSVSLLFDVLPKRYSQAGIIDDFPAENSSKIIAAFTHGSLDTKTKIDQFFGNAKGFGNAISINTLDGVRIFFDNGDIAHLRPSGNAPQLRIYSVADSQERANEIVSQAIAEPSGIFRALEAAVSN